MEKKYSLEYIDNLRIHELRDFARRLGVTSPTTLKKSELVVKISELVKNNNLGESENKYIKNENELDFFTLLTSDNSNILTSLLNKDKEKFAKIENSSAKESTNLNNINTMIIRKSADDSNLYSNINNNVEFSFQLNQGEAVYTVSSEYMVKGYLDIHPNGYGILRQNGFVPNENDCCLTSSLLRQYNLKKGQYICGKAKYVMQNQPRLVYEISEIDGAKSNKLNKNFDDFEFNGIGQEYYLEKFDFKMKKGERHYIERMALSDAVDLGLELVEENATRVFFVNIKARPEDNYKSIDKLQIVNVPFNKSELEVLNTVELVVERIKREFEQDKQNILILYNFSDLVRLINSACEGCVSYDKINSKAVNKIYNIMYLSKYVNENLCCSVMCIDKNGVPRDVSNLMELDLLPLFSKTHNTINKK